MAAQLNDRDRKKGVRRTALLLGLLAFAFYAAFIANAVLHAK